MVVAVRQFILLAVSLKVQIVVTTPKAHEQAKVVMKKIALPFVYVRHFPQYCACERFDVHGQELVVVRTTNLNFCPFLLICFQLGDLPISLRTIDVESSYYDSVLIHKVGEEGRVSVYGIKPHSVFRLYGNIGLKPSLKEMPIDYIEIINGEDTIILDGKEKILDNLRQENKTRKYFLRE